ncbi:uncharacterized protein LOC108205704 isoform X6 [Daucus carota subsp. sativus]
MLCRRPSSLCVRLLQLYVPTFDGRGRAQDTHKSYWDRILSVTKKEQRYDPIIKYEALRQWVAPKYPCANSTFRSYSSASMDSETKTMAEEAQKQKDETLAGTSGKEPRSYIRYEGRRICISDDSDDSTDWYDSESGSDSSTFGSADDETMAEEAQTQKDETLNVNEEEELYHYDSSIKYEPLKTYAVPRFSFSDDFSTDCSDSSSFALDSETENEPMAEHEAQTQKDRILVGTEYEQLLCATDLKSNPAVPDLSTLVLVASSLLHFLHIMSVGCSFFCLTFAILVYAFIVPCLHVCKYLGIYLRGSRSPTSICRGAFI